MAVLPGEKGVEEVTLGTVKKKKKSDQSGQLVHQHQTKNTVVSLTPKHAPLFFFHPLPNLPFQPGVFSQHHITILISQIVFSLSPCLFVFFVQPHSFPTNSLSSSLATCYCHFGLDLAHILDTTFRPLDTRCWPLKPHDYWPYVVKIQVESFSANLALLEIKLNYHMLQ